MLQSSTQDRSLEFALAWEPDGTQTIQHSLGYEPDVRVLDSANRRVLVSVSYPSKNTIVLHTRAPFSGRAVLS
jgi:hypothetical protein